MQDVLTIGSMLGGRSALKRTPKTAQGWHEILQEGLPLDAVESFKAATAMSDNQLAPLIGLSGKTLQRARAKRTRLDAVASDRLFRVARLVALAAQVLEHGERAVAWLSRPQIGLGGKVPFALMTTDAGCDLVEKLLLRIEHSVYS